jgi:lambda family phage tail tape measure protein
MADLSYTVTVNTQQAQAQLQRLQGSINTTGQVARTLGGVLATLTAGLGVREIVQASSAWTDLNSRLRNATGSSESALVALRAITDTARSTFTSVEATSEAFLRNASTLNALGLTTKEQINLSEALTNALAVSGTTGQQAESVMNALSKAFATGKLQGDNFNSVVENGDRLTRALADGLGVSVLQLRELATTGQLTTGRVIEALTSQMARLRQEAEDMPATIRDGFTVLGNSLRELLGAIDQASGGSESLGNILVSVADSIRSLARNAEEMRNAVIIITEFAKRALELGALVLTLTLLGRAFGLLRAGVTALQTGLTRLREAKASLAKTAGSLISQFRAVWREGAITNRTIEGLQKRFKFLGQGLSLITQGLGVFAVALAAVVQSVRAFFGAQEKINEANQKATQSTKTLTQAQIDAQEEERKRLAGLLIAAQEAAKYAQAMTEITEVINRQTRGYRDNFKSQLDSIKAQNSAMNQSQAQQKLSLALQEAENTFLRQRLALQDQLRDAIRDSAAESGKDEEARIRASASIPVLRQALESLNQQYRDQRQAITGLLAVQEEYTRIRELQTFATQQAQRAEDELIRIQRDMARGSMSEIEQAYARIRDAADDSARAAIRAEEARRGAPLNAAEIENYYRVARVGVERLQAVTAAHIRQQRSFAEGWKRAYREYADAATNASRRAEEMFRKTMQGMEDLIVNFARTGKFEWKGFIDSILEELLRSQVRELMASVFNPSGGIFGGLGDLFGTIMGGGRGGTQQRGNSPSQPLYVQQVGGAGSALGNIFGGGQPSTATPGFGGGQDGSFLGSIGNVIGNIGSGIGKVASTIGSGIGNVVSTVASGVGNFARSLFGGFFANGGMLPAGKFGVVGERGPELITGPANITPMTGTQVTYNINAVDAQSFQALLARDPQLIFALTEQGRKSFAGAR